MEAATYEFLADDLWILADPDAVVPLTNRIFAELHAVICRSGACGPDVLQMTVLGCIGDVASRVPLREPCPPELSALCEEVADGIGFHATEGASRRFCERLCGVTLMLSAQIVGAPSRLALLLTTSVVLEALAVRPYRFEFGRHKAAIRTLLLGATEQGSVLRSAAEGFCTRADIDALIAARIASERVSRYANRGRARLYPEPAEHIEDSRRIRYAVSSQLFRTCTEP